MLFILSCQHVQVNAKLISFICYCLSTGLQKIGVAVALLNTNNKHKPLLHSIEISEAKVLIVGQGNVFTMTSYLKYYLKPRAYIRTETVEELYHQKGQKNNIIHLRSTLQIP